MPTLLANNVEITGPDSQAVVNLTYGLVNTSNILGLDTEFTSLNYWETDWHVRTVQFAHGKRAVVLDPFVEEHRTAILYVLENVAEFVCHDVADVLSLHRFLGVDISAKVHDTKVLAQMIWPGPREEHALKPLCTAHIDQGLELAEGTLHDHFKTHLGLKPERKLSRAQIGAAFATIPLDDMAYIKYAGLDAIYVLQLYYKLEALMYTRGVHKAYPDEQKIRACATRMQLRGMRVSQERAHELLEDYGRRHDAAQEEFADKYGCLAKSPKRIQVVLDSGVEIPTRTPKGNYSLGKATVTELAQEYPDNEPLRILQEVADTSNTTTFLRTLLAFVDAEGFVHPDFNTLGAVTGRWTVTDPAIQTVAGINRSVFIPRSGHVIVSADLGQIEPRVAVGLAGETNLIPELLAGSDVYSAGARLAFGARYTKEQRTRIKRVVLGTLYASGVATLVKQARLLDGWLDADHKTVAGVREMWKRAAPEIAEYAKYLALQKEIVLESGRWVPQEPGREYKAINSMCQGTARDVLMTRLLACSAGGLDQYLIATMHDEILLDVPVNEMPKVTRQLRDIMEMGYNGIPTPTDIEVFEECWGSKGVLVDDWLF